MYPIDSPILILPHKLSVNVKIGLKWPFESPYENNVNINIINP